MTLSRTATFASRIGRDPVIVAAGILLPLVVCAILVPFRTSFPNTDAALVLVMVIEGYLISRGVKKLAAQRFPGQSTRGITRYAIMRTLQIRRFRMPSPRVGPGSKV